MRVPTRLFDVRIGIHAGEVVQSRGDFLALSSTKRNAQPRLVRQARYSFQMRLATWSEDEPISHFLK